MAKDLTQTAKFILYTSPSGEVKLDVFVKDETLWLTQKMLAELFDVEIPAISKHLANIFVNGELDEKLVIRKFRTTAVDGKTYEVKHYNLDAIISTGNRRRERDNVVLTSRVRPV